MIRDNGNRNGNQCALDRIDEWKVQKRRLAIWRVSGKKPLPNVKPVTDLADISQRSPVKGTHGKIRLVEIYPADEPRDSAGADQLAERRHGRNQRNTDREY